MIVLATLTGFVRTMLNIPVIANIGAIILTNLTIPLTYLMKIWRNYIHDYNSQC